MRPLRFLTRAATAGALASALALSPLVPALAETAADPRLVLRYNLDQTSGTVAVDTSGNGRNGELVNGGTWAGSEGLKLDGVNDHVRLPNNIMQGLSAITVSTDVLIAPTQATPYFIYGLGNTSSGIGNGYLFSTGDGYRTSIASGNWSTEQTLSQNQPLSRGVWKTITYTLANGTATLFLDGLQVGQKTGVTITPGSIGNGLTTANYLGRSVYSGDKYLSGSLRDFRIYNTALTPAEVAASIAPSDRLRADRDVAALNLGDLSAVTANLSLPSTGVNGSTLAWASSNPAVISNTGVVTRPSNTQGPATVSLTATVTRGEASGTRVFSATVVPAESDEEKLAAAVAGLSLPALSDVRGNITLPPTSGEATVTWQSSNPIIDATGIVTRPTADTDVVLTATLKVGSATGTKEFTAHVKAKPVVAPFAGYAFAYFTGNSLAGENIFMAASRGNDALHWDETNGGKPILTSTMGTKGLRDPFVIRSPEGDKFYMIATDLSIGSGTTWDSSQRQGSQYLEVWESTDLKNWSEQRHVKVSPSTAGNTWAPEAYYDEGIGAYVVFWASKIYAETDPGHTAGVPNKMMYSTTRDFRTFSEAKVWNDPGTSVIDSTVIKDKDTFYRFTKDEAGVSGCVDIMEEKSKNLLAVDLPTTTPRNWSLLASCIGKKAGTSAVEGPTVFKSNTEEKFYLFVDEFGGRGYIPLESTSLEAPNWKLSTNYQLPASPRHGTVLPVTQAELDTLRQTPKPVPANTNGEILRYSFDQTSGTEVIDSSGNGLNGRIIGGASWQADGALKLDGTSGFVDLPDNILSGVQDVTVEADVLVSGSQSGAYFIYGLGNTDAGGVGNGYLFATGNSVYKTGIASGNWSTEQLASSTSALPRDSWKHLVYTLNGAVATVYLDGIKVGENTNTTLNPADIGLGSTTANYLGKSVYSADKTLNGAVREFAIYNRALSAAEVHTISGDTAAPTVSLTTEAAAPSGAEGWYADPVTVNVAASDNSGAAPTVEVSVDGGAWVPYTHSFEVASDGDHTVMAKASDGAGNTSEQASIALKIDRTAPQVSATVDDDRTLTLTAEDPYSGVASLEYRVGAAQWQAYSGPLPAGRTAATVEFRAMDKAGNSTQASVEVPAPAAQSISFDAITSKTLGDADFAVNATSSSGLPVTFSATGACTLLGTSVHLTGAGNCTVTARQEGSVRFLAAPDVARSFVVSAPVLDSFDRANGAVGPSWKGEDGRQSYTIKENALVPLLGGALLYADTLGQDQTASLTLKSIAPKSVQGVLLKAQSEKSFLSGGVSAVYDASSKTVRVSALGVEKSVWHSYSDVPALFGAGDVLTASYVDGTVTVYRNTEVIATVPLRTEDAQFFAGKTGKAGVWSSTAAGSILDNFRAATITHQ